uniref:Prephenate/arogenate dehydrogenase domain-containing protein n=1 Tax=Kalanchoe fedtschenkoi TaxID=63787 RepID=A0A7N0TUR8_KALFE
MPVASASGTARAAFSDPLSLSPHPKSYTSHIRFTTASYHNRRRRHRFLQVRALDAAQSFDYESKLSLHFNSAPKLKIAIIGFGNFGQFLARTLIRQGHTVLAHSRSDYTDVAANLGATFFPDPHDVCEQHPDVVLLCTSIISSEQVLNSLPLHRFKRNTLFVDVLSVKEFPKSLLLRTLPPHFDILCTHPMFGPQSGKNGWSGLSFVYEKVRIGNEESRISRSDKFLDIFEREGCKMVEMSCAEHDMHAVRSQFLTHTVGRILHSLELESTDINTKGYESLLDLVENTSGDSFDLYYGLFMYNTNAMEQLERLDLGFEALRKQLFGHVHGILRKQLFGSGDNGLAGKKVQLLAENSTVSGFSNNSHALAKVTQSLRPEDIFSITSYKALFSNSLGDSEKLRIAVVGFGNFGQFIAKTMVRQGHHVLAYSRSNYVDVAQNMGATFFSDADDLCEEHPDVVLLCTSILSTEKVLKSLPLQRLKRSTLFVDVLSVKEFPKNFFIQNLPADFDILCTHPMFGPESGKNGWNGLPFVYDKVRIGTDESRVSRCKRFLDIFSREGCRMVEMSCVEHDRNAAGTQFITHTVGRILEKLHLKSTPINTKGYDTLLNLVSNTAGDSFDLYYGLFMYNQNAMEQLERLDLAFESLKKELFEQLHGVVRKQLFDDVGYSKISTETYVTSNNN